MREEYLRRFHLFRLTWLTERIEFEILLYPRKALFDECIASSGIVGTVEPKFLFVASELFVEEF